MFSVFGARPVATSSCSTVSFSARAAVGPTIIETPSSVTLTDGSVEAGLRHDLDAAPGEAALEGLADVAVFERDDPGQVLEQRDGDAEVVIQRGELGADRARADDGDRLRQVGLRRHVVRGDDPSAVGHKARQALDAAAGGEDHVRGRGGPARRRFRACRPRRLARPGWSRRPRDGRCRRSTSPCSCRRGLEAGPHPLHDLVAPPRDRLVVEARLALQQDPELLGLLEAARRTRPIRAAPWSGCSRRAGMSHRSCPGRRGRRSCPIRRPETQPCSRRCLRPGRSGRSRWWSLRPWFLGLVLRIGVDVRSVPAGPITGNRPAPAVGWRNADRREAVRRGQSRKSPPGRRTTRAQGPGRQASESGSVAAGAPEAVAAIDGLAIGRLERHLGRAAALAAGGRVHLARAAIVASAVGGTALRSGGLSRSAAGTAALGFGESPLGVEVLLARGKYELLAAVGADQNLVRVHENLELLSVARSLRVLAANPREARSSSYLNAHGQPASFAAGLYVCHPCVHRVRRVRKPSSSVRAGRDPHR